MSGRRRALEAATGALVFDPAATTVRGTLEAHDPYLCELACGWAWSECVGTVREVLRSIVLEDGSRWTDMLDRPCAGECDACRAIAASAVRCPGCRREHERREARQ